MISRFLTEFDDPSKNWAKYLPIKLSWRFGESFCHCFTKPHSIHGGLCKLSFGSHGLVLKL